jgi:aminoglycoside 2''-phosphotransferase
MKNAPGDLLERIYEISPEMKAVPYRLDKDALTSFVFIFKDSVVFRFPKSSQAGKQLVREIKTLNLVSEMVDLPVPSVIDYGPDFMMYAYLHGEPLYWHDWLTMSVPERRLIGFELAKFLHQLHNIPKEKVSEIGLPKPSKNRNGAYQKLFESVQDKLYPYFWKDQRSFYDCIFKPVITRDLDLDDFQPALIHNDLASYHILYNPETGSLSGVLDFGTAELGDPADDIAILINTYGEKFVEMMVPEYSEIPTLRPRARFKALAIELEWALKGIRDSDPAWLLVHLGRARDIRVGR